MNDRQTMTDDRRPATGDDNEPDPLYTDIARFLELSDEQLAFALAAWCQYRAADGGLIELLVDHVQQMNEHDKLPYFQQMLERHPFVADYPHHVKAVSLASCKYNQAFHPELVQSLLESNKHIPEEILLETLAEKLSGVSSQPSVRKAEC